MIMPAHTSPASTASKFRENFGHASVQLRDTTAGALKGHLHGELERQLDVRAYALTRGLGIYELKKALLRSIRGYVGLGL
jgi:hypothetical protein